MLYANSGGVVLGRQRGLRFVGQGGPPAGTAGQTLVWRAGFASTGTLASGTPSNFSVTLATAQVTGTAYTRPVGPRFGTAVNDPAWSPGGWSLRVPSRAVAGSPTTVFDGPIDIRDTGIISTPNKLLLQACGMWCGWFKFAGIPGGSSQCRTLSVYGAGGSLGGTPNQYNFSANIKLTGSASTSTSLVIQGGNNAGTTAVTMGSLNQWVYLALVWSLPNVTTGSGTKTYSVYAMLQGQTTPTLISTGTVAATDVSFVPAVLRMRALYSEISVIDPWYGACGGLSAYSLDQISTGALYPTDMAQPQDNPAYWYVDPVNGNDSNSGFSANAAWATASKLTTELSYGTVLANYKPWRDSSGTDQGLATVTTFAQMLTWRDAYKAGNRVPFGDVVTVMNGSLYTGSRIIFESLPGCTLTGTGGGSITIMQNIGSTFTQPNVGTYPNVWQILGAGYGGVTVSGITGTCMAGGYEGTRLYLQQGGANLAAVIATLNTTPGSCFADASGFYFSTFSGANPNSDGVTRRVATILASVATSAGVVAMGDGLIKGIAVEGGPLLQTSTGTGEPQYAVSGAIGTASIRDNCTFSQGSYHSSGMTGNGTTGMQGELNCTHQRMSTNGGAITTVAFTADTATTGARIFSWFDGCTVLNAQAPGSEAAANLGQDDWYSHSDAGRTAAIFTAAITNCTYCGGLSVHLANDNEFTCDTSTIMRIQSDSVGVLVQRTKTLAATNGVFTNDLTLRNCIILGNASGYSLSPAGFNATITYDRCTIDLSTLSISGALTHNTAGTLSLTSCAVIASPSGFGLQVGGTTADVVSISHTEFLGNATPTILKSYNDGVTTADRTYAQCVALGMIATSGTSASVGLDSASNYAVQGGSPVIGVAVAGANVVDYTGTVFASRADAGARNH